MTLPSKQTHDALQIRDHHNPPQNAGPEEPRLPALAARETLPGGKISGLGEGAGNRLSDGLV